MNLKTRSLDSATATAVAYIWGRMPPPVGGVTRSAEHLLVALRINSIRVVAIDPGKPTSAVVAALRALTRPCALSIFNFSSTQTIGRLVSYLAMALPHRAIAFVHAHQSFETASHDSQKALRRYLARFDEVWTTNRFIAEFLCACGVEQEVRLVSPSSSQVGPVSSVTTVQRYPRIAVAAWRGLDLYGADLAIQAVGRYRAAGFDAELDLLLYGGLDPEGHKLLELAALHSWVTVHRELSESDVSSLLTESAILLRPTDTDGDSMLVREAVRMGLRVIATDVAHRPAGVELVERGVEPIFLALVNGAPKSTGEGLGQPVDIVTMGILRELRCTKPTRLKRYFQGP